jgi:hypothetical protein
MGKYYPFTHSQSDPKSFAVSERDAISFANYVGNTVSFTVADFRVSPFNPG